MKKRNQTLPQYNSIIWDDVENNRIVNQTKVATANPIVTSTDYYTKYTPFTVRTVCPSATDKYVKCYIQRDAGWSAAILGKPTHDPCNVLSNCVGFAQGRFCEIYNEIMKTTGNKYMYLNCNAENFPQRARDAYPDILMGKIPKPGSIIVWEGVGNLAGHVAVVEQVVDENHIYITDSAYNGRTFQYYLISNENGNWGRNDKDYIFTCFMYNPAVKETLVKLAQPVDQDCCVNQLYVMNDNFSRIRETSSLSGTVLGACKAGYFNYYDVTEADDHIWYKLAENQWVAKTGYINVYPAIPPEVVKLEIASYPQLVYDYGQYIDLSQLTLIGQLNNGKLISINLKDCILSPIETLISPLTKDVNIYIEYNNLQVQLTIKVNDPKLIGIKLTGEYKVNYIAEETLNYENLQVIGIYEDNSEKEISEYDVFPEAGTKVTEDLNESAIKITYKQFSTEFIIHVEPLKFVAFHLMGNYKTSYEVQDPLDLTGLLVRGELNNGCSILVTDFTSKPEPGTILTTEDTLVNIYNSQYFLGSYKIKVNKKLSFWQRLINFIKQLFN